MRSVAPPRPKTLEDLGIERKPFYTTAEVARIVGMSDQSVLDRIHLPAGDTRHLYAVSLGPRTYRVPVGALAQLVGIEPQTTVSRHPRRIDDVVRAEVTGASARASKKRGRSR